jgi:hypothetical protein
MDGGGGGEELFNKLQQLNVMARSRLEDLGVERII